MKKWSLLIVLIVSLNEISYSQNDTLRKPLTVSISFGYISGNDYGYALKNYTQEQLNGGYLGFLSLDIRFNMNLTKNFSVCPGINALSDFNIILATSSDPNVSADASPNFIFLPGVSVKYYFYNHGLTSLLVSPGISTLICTSSLSDFIYKPNGIEKEIFLGFEHSYGYYTRKNKLIRRGCFGLKLGYMSIPVNVQDSNTNIFNKKDFGGFAFGIYGNL
jgi:hypothetical protein